MLCCSQVVVNTTSISFMMISTDLSPLFAAILGSAKPAAPLARSRAPPWRCLNPRRLTYLYRRIFPKGRWQNALSLQVNHPDTP